MINRIISCTYEKETQSHSELKFRVAHFLQFSLIMLFHRVSSEGQSTVKNEAFQTQSQILTIHVQLIGLLAAPRHTGYFARVSASVRCLHLKDLQEAASLDVLSLQVGQDGLSHSVPGDGGRWDPTPFTLQRYHCVQQGCDICGRVPTFDGGRDWRKGKIMSNIADGQI